MVMVYVILTAVLSIAMYAYAYHASRETIIVERKSMVGYYACIGALRWMEIVRRSGTLDSICGFNPTDTNYETAALSVRSAFPTLAADLGLSAPHDVTLTVTERTPAEGGGYRVSAAYS